MELRSRSQGALSRRALQRHTHDSLRQPWARCSRRSTPARCSHRTIPSHGRQQRAAFDRAALAVTDMCTSVAADTLRPAAASPVASCNKLRVAVDVDEVLGRFVHALNDFCKQRYGMSYDVSDYWVYEYAKIWGCSQDQSSHIVHEFFKSPHFMDGIPVVPGALDALQRLTRYCDLVVVTSRQHVIQDATLDWIDRHYPGLFSEVYFGNHFALEGSSRKKSDICASIGAQVLIDDNVAYALDCAASGMRVLLYDWEGSYPWSKLPPGSEHPNIQVVHSWAEVEHALRAMALASSNA